MILMNNETLAILKVVGESSLTLGISNVATYHYKTPTCITGCFRCTFSRMVNP